jgi:ATP-dependent DNA helicase RecG
MVVEHAERFGLSQLHQLRGRIGRGHYSSTCILLAQYRASEEAKVRLRAMEKTTDGFKIAEEDLELRGPGEFFGIRQSGLPDFRVAHILRDAPILIEARKEAFQLVQGDPELVQPSHAGLKQTLVKRWKGRMDLATIG